MTSASVNDPAQKDVLNLRLDFSVTGPLATQKKINSRLFQTLFQTY